MTQVEGKRCQVWEGGVRLSERGNYKGKRRLGTHAGIPSQCELTKVVALTYGIAGLSERLCGKKAPESHGCKFLWWPRGGMGALKKDYASIIHPGIDTIRRDRILSIIANYEATRYSRSRQTGCSPGSR